MRVILDTNVLYQALRSSKGASRAILNLIIDQKVQISISTPVFKEYEEVLNRNATLEDMKAEIEDINNLLSFIAYVGKEQSIYFNFRPNLRDEDDNQFIELALSSNSDYLITSNINDFIIGNELKFQDLKIVTPTKFMEIWRRNYES